MVVALPAVALLCALVAVYQWMELLLADAGVAPGCSIDDRFDCLGVWQAPLAKGWQAITGVPLAGWGLLWALMAFGAALWLANGQLQRRARGPSLAAVQLVSLGGSVVVLALFAYSLSLGKLCLTCVTTYILVAIYCALVWALSARLPRPAAGSLVSTAYPTAGAALAVAAVVGYGVLWIPGHRTPLPDQPPEPAEPSERAKASTTGSNAVADFVRRLPPKHRRLVAQGLEAYRAAPRPELPPPTDRPAMGSAEAVVRVTDFSDLRCPHCANLALEMAPFVETAGAESVRWESRFYPLDAECNGRLNPRATDGSRIRCFAAKALLCCQQSEEYESLRLRMFKEQRTLTIDRVKELVSELVGMDPDDLASCIGAPETAAKLDEDIEYASRFDIRGTPMVVMNGRRVLAFPPLLKALMLAKGDPNHPGFEQLASR